MRTLKIAITRIIKKNSSRKYLADFAQQAANSISPGARVLDAGAGDCPYRSLFRHALYDSTDLCLVEKQYEKLTFICDLAKIPVIADCYDLVFCSQTLEHVPDPKSLLAELYRVLKPGGKLYLSAPLFYEEHEIPYDYYRFTRYGITYLLEQVSFQIKSITWLEGYYGTLAYQLKVGATALPLSSGDYGGQLRGVIMVFFAWLIKLIFSVLSILFTSLDIKHKYTGGGVCKNYAIVAQK
jgi:SAM-dependent methyltransferase